MLPFASPLEIPNGLANLFIDGRAPDTLLFILFCVTVGYWLVYTVTAVYHWLTYAHAPGIAIPSIALHLFVSLCLIGYVLVTLP